MNKRYLLFVLAGVFGIFLVSAALISIFGGFSTLVSVQQSILVDEGSYIVDEIPEASPGGEYFCFKHWINNRVSVDAEVAFDTAYSPDGEGITTTYYELPSTTTLVLENKDTSWNPISDDTTATLTYLTVNPEFDYDLTAEGLQPSTSYALIYYADKEDRFNQLGTPTLIGTGTSNQQGELSLSDSVELNSNLPKSYDFNKDVYDYCVSDGYEHCHGAKFWLIPSSDYNPQTQEITAWNPTTYLFETDLGYYFDCDLGVDDYMTHGQEILGNLLTHSRQDTPILVCYDFALNIAPGTYNITTTVVPA